MVPDRERAWAAVPQWAHSVSVTITHMGSHRLCASDRPHVTTDFVRKRKGRVEHASSGDRRRLHSASSIAPPSLSLSTCLLLYPR